MLSHQNIMALLHGRYIAQPYLLPSSPYEVMELCPRTVLSHCLPQMNHRENGTTMWRFVMTSWFFQVAIGCHFFRFLLLFVVSQNWLVSTQTMSSYNSLNSVYRNLLLICQPSKISPSPLVLMKSYCTGQYCMKVAMPTHLDNEATVLSSMLLFSLIICCFLSEVRLNVEMAMWLCLLDAPTTELQSSRCFWQVINFWYHMVGNLAFTFQFCLRVDMCGCT